MDSYDLVSRPSLTLSDKDTATCLSGTSYGTTTRFLRIRFPWPAMPRSTLNFYALVHGDSNLICSSFKMLVPQDNTKPILLGDKDDTSFAKCNLLEGVSTGSGVACSFFCVCEVHVCPSVLLFTIDKNAMFCEVEFSAIPFTI